MQSVVVGFVLKSVIFIECTKLIHKQRSERQNVAYRPTVNFVCRT